jgi:hypothetical protein
LVVDTSQIISVCVGIQTSIPDFGTLVGQRVLSQNVWVPSGPAQVGQDLSQAFVPTCFGAESIWTNWGRLLWRVGPAAGNLRRAVAGSKDHVLADGGNTWAWGLQLRRL